MPSVSSLDEAAAVLRAASARRRQGATRRRPRRRRDEPRPRARGRRPDVHRRVRHPPVGTRGCARPRRPAPLARSSRRPDDRRLPGRQSLRPAAPPLRCAPRPRPRRHARPRRRHDRERGRQGRQERRGLRPRQARVWLGGAAGLHRAGQPAPPSHSRRRRHRRRRDGRSRLHHGGAARIAARAERTRRPPPRPGRSAVRGRCRGGRSPGGRHESSRRRSRGRRRGVGRVALPARRRSAGRTSFAPGALRELLERVPAAVVRPAAGIAYLPDVAPDETPEPVRLLQERVRARFDPQGVLS